MSVCMGLFGCLCRVFRAVASSAEPSVKDRLLGLPQEKQMGNGLLPPTS